MVAMTALGCGAYVLAGAHIFLFSHSAFAAGERAATETTSVAVNLDTIAQQPYVRGVMMAAAAPSPRTTEPKIVEVSVPPDSSDGPSWSSNQNVWTETFPIKDVDHIGIGYIVEPEPFHRSWSEADFVMHDHMYISPGVPDPRRANITYRFSKPAKIGEVLIVQHANGIGQIEGFIGNDEKSMKSIGRASSTLGANLPLKDGTFVDGYRDLFKFERSGEGKLFRIVITKTPLPNGYAFFRAYPRNGAHKPYEVLSVEDVPKPGQ
jgi:hypothetical protein